MSPRTTQKKRDKDEARSKSWIREERLLAYEWKWAWPLMIMMAKKGRKSRLPWWDSRGGIRRQMRALPPPGGRCQWWYWPESWLELRSKLYDSDWPWFSPSFSLSLDLSYQSDPAKYKLDAFELRSCLHYLSHSRLFTKGDDDGIFISQEIIEMIEENLK